MRLTIGCLLFATLALAACGSSDDASSADPDTAPEATQASAATTSTRPLYSDTDDRAAAPTTSESAATPSSGATITIESFSFGAPLTVGVGDQVTVVNEDGVTHTWTSDDEAFDSGTLGSGDSFEYSFDDPGEYSFFCEIHPGMTGTITVTG